MEKSYKMQQKRFGLIVNHSQIRKNPDILAPMFVLSTKIFSLYTVCLSNFSTKIDLAFFPFPTIQKQV